MQNIEECQKKLPENGLRQALYKLSATPECFFMLRNNFGKSLAVMSITHWILGIGDRNLGNFLIDTTNGKMIGVDFNMAFGTATRNQSIPDLLPFRLTTQFVNALKPLETSGFLAKSMVHVLRAFNLENESIMAALEVFVHEPTTAESAISSKPEVLLKTIKDKLSGINPIIPITNDIKTSIYSRYDNKVYDTKKRHIHSIFSNLIFTYKFVYSDADVILAYTRLITGLPNTYRNKIKKRILTVEEQVKCLIDIARDPCVLGVSYIGLQPWI